MYTENEVSALGDTVDDLKDVLIIMLSDVRRFPPIPKEELDEYFELQKDNKANAEKIRLFNQAYGLNSDKYWDGKE